MPLQAKERLLNGEELGEAFMIQVILEKLDSLEIEHYGNDELHSYACINPLVNVIAIHTSAA